LSIAGSNLLFQVSLRRLTIPIQIGDSLLLALWAGFGL